MKDTTAQNEVGLRALDAHRLLYQHPTGSGLLPAGGATGIEPAASDEPTTSLSVRSDFLHRVATFLFDLPQDGLVRVTLHDAFGRRVAVVKNGWRPAGSHASIWCGRDTRGERVAAGVYFPRLTSRGGTSSRKVLIGD